MTREDALYQKLLLAAGFWEQYESWLAEFVEKEDPLSDLALDLSWCGGNFNLLRVGNRGLVSRKAMVEGVLCFLE